MIQNLFIFIFLLSSIKTRVLKSLRVLRVRNNYSENFLFDIASKLISAETGSHHHQQHNIDLHTLPFCGETQAKGLLKLWNITRFDQLSYTLSLKLIKFHPQLVLILLDNQLQESLKLQKSYDVGDFFSENEKIFSKLCHGQSSLFYQQLCQYVLDLLGKGIRSSQSSQALPQFISTYTKQYFHHAPQQMIELLKLVTTDQDIQAKQSWSSTLPSLEFPRNFSQQDYIQVFMVLYERISNLDTILSIFFTNQTLNNLYSIEKRRKYFFEQIIQQKIGEQKFLKKLYPVASFYNTLTVLQEYPQLTSSLSKYLLIQEEKEEQVDAIKKLKYLEYDYLEPNYDNYLNLMKQTNADVSQRLQNILSLLKCAIRNRQCEEKVLIFIEKSLVNEQLMIIEGLINTMTKYDNYYHLNLIIKYEQIFETIFNYAFIHKQRTSSTLSKIFTYAIHLIIHVEQCKSKKLQTEILTFANKLIKR
ncbi:unnamed protein product [Didymodactylos carnosus]|uniref:Uncharacterized protein n=1 Tax=Didymodactylos carnosus TaxID=1234261 RepID=A0A815MLW0_9BILA|nr:unnamed protein product [Didymodactylos carnosus]CAF1425040.1 unnamed protein product [Didymodactylos carnosus]CAF3596412.1 unnamed protein product [Didymodactylos carnosus]CAF4306135.1 unnamed protein product [Didymodactylos carnosus]